MVVIIADDGNRFLSYGIVEGTVLFEEDDTDKYNQAFSVPNFDTAWILLDEIHNALSLLTEKERVRTYCFYFKKMSLKEIAQKYNCAVTSVEDSIANARKKLKKFIKNP